MNLPLFSFIIPCFNHGQYLTDSLSSILVQSFPHWEAIIVNDGSEDSSKSVADSFVKSDSRFFLVNQVNKGLSESRNVGIQISKGKYLIFLDADDWVEMTFLNRLVDLINGFPEVDLYRFGYSYFDKPNGHFFHRHSPAGGVEVYPFVLTQNLGPCHSIVVNKDFALKVGDFDSSLKSCEDWDFWIRAGKLGAKMISIPDALVAYRYVPNSMSRNAYQMYLSLSEVSKRAFDKDFRLPEDAPFNIKISTDFGFIQKHHLIRCLGILIHQGKVQEAVTWFIKEKDLWNWEVSIADWQGLSTALSWKYFLDHNYIEEVFMNIKPSLSTFFLALGYKEAEATKIISNVIKPQRFRMNHHRYGKILGALINRLRG